MDTPVQVAPERARCRIAPTALALLESARHGLANAADETGAGGRYVAAHLAALRAAAAVVAARPAPETGRRRKAPRSVWELLPRVEPALAEWAAFFAAGAGKRAAAEAGLPRAVSAREADDLLRDAETFLSLAEQALGVSAQAALPLRSTG
jgi:SAV_6107-like HEPN